MAPEQEWNIERKLVGTSVAQRLDSTHLWVAECAKFSAKGRKWYKYCTVRIKWYKYCTVRIKSWFWTADINYGQELGKTCRIILILRVFPTAQAMLAYHRILCQWLWIAMNMGMNDHSLFYRFLQISLENLYISEEFTNTSLPFYFYIFSVVYSFHIFHAFYMQTNFNVLGALTVIYLVNGIMY
jgi:hypothetical protein